jgi:hypothetical protein
MTKLLLVACALTIYLLANPLDGYATPAMTSNSCHASAYRQFDFWLGDWDTYRINNDQVARTSVARNRVTSILGGCALHEAYTRTDGYAGESFTTYDMSRKVWHQTWVSNQGELTVVEGTQEGDSIVLTGRIVDTQGEQLQRVSWASWHGGVREICMGSRDGGKTWTVLFDVQFRKHQA